VLDFCRNLVTIGLSVSSSQPQTPVSTPNQSALDLALAPQQNANVATVHALFRQNGLNLVGLLFDGLIYRYPRDIVVDVVAILKLLAEMLPGDSQQWMVAIVERYSADYMTVEKRRTFLTDYTAAIQEQQWNKVRSILTDFVAFYRRKNLPPRSRRVGAPSIALK
jgi:transportin-3